MVRRVTIHDKPATPRIIKTLQHVLRYVLNLQRYVGIFPVSSANIITSSGRYQGFINVHVAEGFRLAQRSFDVFWQPKLALMVNA